MANPSIIRWTAPTEYTDGSSFGQADLAGWQILVDDNPAVVVPAAWNEEGVYVFPLASLGLTFGTYNVRVQTVASNGGVSAPSNAVPFTLKDERVPNAPFGVTVE